MDFTDLLVKMLTKKEITEEEIKQIILEDEELRVIYDQNAIITAILGVLISKGLTTKEEIEKLKAESLEALINRDAKEYMEKFNEVMSEDDE